MPGPRQRRDTGVGTIPIPAPALEDIVQGETRTRRDAGPARAWFLRTPQALQRQLDTLTAAYTDTARVGGAGTRPYTCPVPEMDWQAEAGRQRARAERYRELLVGMLGKEVDGA